MGEKPLQEALESSMSLRLAIEREQKRREIANFLDDASWARLVAEAVYGIQGSADFLASIIASCVLGGFEFPGPVKAYIAPKFLQMAEAGTSLSFFRKKGVHKKSEGMEKKKMETLKKVLDLKDELGDTQPLRGNSREDGIFDVAADELGRSADEIESEFKRYKSDLGDRQRLAAHLQLIDLQLRSIGSSERNS